VYMLGWEQKWRLEFYLHLKLKEFDVKLSNFVRTAMMEKR